MAKIKICGITRIEDLQELEKLDIDFFGMIFYPPSPRFVSIEKAKKITNHLTNYSSIKKVGVFVNEPLENLKQTISKLKLDLVQLHGDESLEYCQSIDIPVIKVFRVESENDLKKITQYKKIVPYILLDTKLKNLYGGTGKKFDWNILTSSKLKNCNWFLSGGLNGENFKEGLKFNPYAIDFNSGVEKSPGIKDIALIKKIVQTIKML